MYWRWWRRRAERAERKAAAGSGSLPENKEPGTEGGCSHDNARDVSNKIGDVEDANKRSQTPPFYDFDDLVAGLQGEIGAVQRRLTTKIQERVQRDIERTDEESTANRDHVIYVVADGENPEVRLPLVSARHRRIPVLTEVEISLQAAVEEYPERGNRYALVFGPAARTLERRLVCVTVRMLGLQPGETVIEVEGKLLKRIPRPESGVVEKG